MEVFLTNICNFYDDIESFVVAKGKLEKELIKQKKIEKKLSVNEFISQIDFSHSVAYIDTSDHKKMKNISMVMYNLPNDELLIFYVSSFPQEYNDNLFNKLKNINYDLSKLIKISQLDIFTKDIKEYFIINGDFYMYPENIDNN